MQRADTAGIKTPGRRRTGSGPLEPADGKRIRTVESVTAQAALRTQSVGEQSTVP